jgi:hypothetical protein
MGHKFAMEIILSDAVLEACKQYDIHVCRIACEAVQEAILMKQQIAEHCDQMIPGMENRALRELLAETMAELEMSRKELRENMMRDRLELESICLIGAKK